MTQTNDPPLISSLELIPDAAEKADLDAPNDSGGKLVTGQAPNITITQTTVVADADERLALDVQEGDIAIQTNVSTSFIFTGGNNVANNWQTIDFDAVGAIDGENINPRDITPRNITASGDISLQDLTVSGALNGADTSAAAAGEALTSDGTGGFGFAAVGGDALTQMSEFLSQANMSQIAASQSDMQEVINTGLFQNVTASSTAMQEVAASSTAMQEVINSPPALNRLITTENVWPVVGLSNTAQSEIENSSTAISELNSITTPFADDANRTITQDARITIPQTNEAYAVYINQASYTGPDDGDFSRVGLFDGSDNYLGKNISNVFVDQLTYGWDSQTSFEKTRNLSASGEGLIFHGAGLL